MIDGRTADGIIPACAGSTPSAPEVVGGVRDHPRMCGEHAFASSSTLVAVGSSPHVRGALGAVDLPMQPYGIIPACAGSTLF